MDASQGDIALGWLISYVLAALVLVGLILLVPQSEKLWVGKDNRTSTSKVQVLLWTYAILFALWAFFFAWLLVTVGEAIDWRWAESLEDALLNSFDDKVLEPGLDETYLLLLGFPAAGAVTAKAMTVSKIESGTIVKQDKPESGGDTSRARELVSDDDGSPDVGDYQYVLFSVLAIAYFLAQFLAHPSRGLPDMPDTLVALTGVAAATYVAKKGIYREPPVLLSVDPPQGAPGDEVVLYGQRLQAPRPAGAAADPATTPTSTVLFANTPAVVRTADPGGDRLVVEVPRRLTAGATKVMVVRPPGARSEQLDFEVLDAAPTVTSVVPSTIKFGVIHRVRIVGGGFLAGELSSGPRNAVTIDNKVVSAAGTSWNEEDIEVVLPDLASAETLGLNQNASVQLVVFDAKGRPSQPQPITLEKNE